MGTTNQHFSTSDLLSSCTPMTYLSVENFVAANGEHFNIDNENDEAVILSVKFAGDDVFIPKKIYPKTNPFLLKEVEKNEVLTETQLTNLKASLPLRSVVHDGTLLNLPDWTNSPYFNLPDIGLTLISDKTSTIYGDTLINVPIVNNLTVEYTCAIGAQSGNNFVITPSASNIGDHSLAVKFKHKGKLFFQKTIKFTVYALAPDLSKKILMIGDSLVFNAGAVTAYGISQVLGFSPIWLGTQVSPQSGYPVIHYEGKSGATWDTFANTANTPFFKAGVLDIPAYFADNTIDAPDYILIRLGVNDAYINSDNQSVNYGIPDACLATIMANAKKFIDAFLAFNPSLKIIVGLPTVCSNTVDGWNANYDETRFIQDTYISNVHKIEKALLDFYANGIYNDRVDTSYEVCFLDRDLGYTKVGGLHTNGVHPDYVGYDQMGKGLALALNKQMAEDVMNDVNTLGDYDWEKLVTISGSNVTAWGSKTGTNNLGKVGNPTMTSEGIRFENAIMGASFTYAQPEFIYLVLKIEEWQSGKLIFDGAIANRGKLMMAISSPRLYLNGGSYAAQNETYTFGKFAIIRFLFNAALSSLQINELTKTTGNPGTNAMGGITIGGSPNAADYSKLVVKRMIVRDSSAKEADIFNYLKAKYSMKDF